MSAIGSGILLGLALWGVGLLVLACFLLRDILKALRDVRLAISNLNIAVNTASDPREFGRELNKVLRRAR